MEKSGLAFTTKKEEKKKAHEGPRVSIDVSVLFIQEAHMCGNHDVFRPSSYLWSSKATKWVDILTETCVPTQPRIQYTPTNHAVVDESLARCVVGLCAALEALRNRDDDDSALGSLPQRLENLGLRVNRDVPGPVSGQHGTERTVKSSWEYNARVDTMATGTNSWLLIGSQPAAFGRK
jgi:hypothetical protein